ncbi:MAG: energy transducer TonB [Acidobacteriota bacterium]
MKTLRIVVVSFLVLATVAAGVLVHQRHVEEEGRQSLRRYRAAQRRLEKQRVAICEKRRSVPLEPSDVPPLRLTGDEWVKWKDKPFTPPNYVHADLDPLAGSNPVGEFVVEALIDESGCVRQVKVLRSPNRSLDAATVASFEKWVYLPATWNHRPVRVIDTLRLNFPPAESGFFRDRVLDEDGYPVL